MAEPLTRLTSIKQPFAWPPEAAVAFKEIKQLFSSPPVLIHPDPEKQFVVEVDASATGVGAVLSQHSGSALRLRPCAFFPGDLALLNSTTVWGTENY